MIMIMSVPETKKPYGCYRWRRDRDNSLIYESRVMCLYQNHWHGFKASSQKVDNLLDDDDDADRSYLVKEQKGSETDPPPDQPS